jgi:hypothetical protein
VPQTYFSKFKLREILNAKYAEMKNTVDVPINNPDKMMTANKLKMLASRF